MLTLGEGVGWPSARREWFDILVAQPDPGRAFLPLLSLVRGSTFAREVEGIHPNRRHDVYFLRSKTMGTCPDKGLDADFRTRLLRMRTGSLDCLCGSKQDDEAIRSSVGYA